MNPLPNDWRIKQSRMMDALLGDLTEGKGTPRLDAMRAVNKRKLEVQP